MIDPYTAAAYRLGGDDPEALAKELRGATRYHFPYKEGKTEEETCQNRNRAEALSREFAMADLNAFMEAEAPEGAWRGWNYLLRAYPEACPRLTELFVNWEKVFPEAFYPMDLPIWERLSLYWPEHLPAEPGVLDEWELNTLESQVLDRMKLVVEGQVRARVSGGSYTDSTYYSENRDVDPTVTWERITAPMPPAADALAKFAWNWLTDEEMTELLEDLVFWFDSKFDADDKAVPQWMWQWLEANPDNWKHEYVLRDCREIQQRWEEQNEAL